MNFSQTQKKRCASKNSKLKTVGNHDEFLSRIKKTLYYGKLPPTDRLSLPVTELAAELYSEVKKERKSLERLDIDEAAKFTHAAGVSPSSLVLALVYLERLKSCNPDYLDKSAPFDLFLISVMVASKFLHDEGEFNEDWASFAAMDTKQINQLEKEFLNAMSWEVYVSENLFWNRLEDLETYLALKEGQKRGFFQYTELSFLLDFIDFVSVARSFFSISAVCLTSYTAFFLTAVGSVIVGSQVHSTLSQLARLSPVFNSVAKAPGILEPTSTSLPTNETDLELKEEDLVAIFNAFESESNRNVDLQKWLNHDLLVQQLNSEICSNSSNYIKPPWKKSSLYPLQSEVSVCNWISASCDTAQTNWFATIPAPLYLKQDFGIVTR